MISPWFPPFFPITSYNDGLPTSGHAANWSTTTEGSRNRRHGWRTENSSGNTWTLEDSWIGYGDGSIPINSIFRGMNIHLPAILMFTRGTRFWPTAIFSSAILLKLHWRISYLQWISPINYYWCDILYWNFTHNTEYHINNIYIYIYIVYYSNKFIYWKYHVLSYTMNIFCIWYSLLIHYAFIIIYQTVLEQTVLYVISIKHYRFSW